MRYEFDRNSQIDDEELFGGPNLAGGNGGNGGARSGAEGARSGGDEGLVRGRKDKGHDRDDDIDLDPTNAFTLYVAIDTDGGGSARQGGSCNYALKKLVKATKHFFDYFTVDDMIGGVREDHSCDSEIVTVYAVTVYGTCLKTIEVYADFIADDLDLESIYVVENSVMAGVFERNCRRSRRK